MIMYDAGADQREKISGRNYFGSDKYVAGMDGDEYKVKHEAKNIICPIQVPGAVILETRCNGVIILNSIIAVLVGGVLVMRRFGSVIGIFFEQSLSLWSTKVLILQTSIKTYLASSSPSSYYLLYS